MRGRVLPVQAIALQGVILHTVSRAPRAAVGRGWLRESAASAQAAGRLMERHVRLQRATKSRGASSPKPGPSPGAGARGPAPQFAAFRLVPLMIVSWTIDAGGREAGTDFVSALPAHPRRGFEPLLLTQKTRIQTPRTPPRKHSSSTIPGTTHGPTPRGHCRVLSASVHARRRIAE